MRLKTALARGLTAIALTATLGLVAQARAAAAIQAVGVENEYADVIGQIGGTYVHVTTIMSDPNTDPHSFEVSPRIAASIAGADLIVENGIGYDSWADKMIAAAPKVGRQVINVQHLRALPDDTANPHLWYDPATMPLVAQAIAAKLSALDPAHAAYFASQEAAFAASLKPWFAALATFKVTYPNTAVAVTEPVGDYMLHAAGATIETPWALEAAIMNDTDPAPQDVTKQNALLKNGAVKVFLYNQQVTDPLTQSFLELAHKAGIPVVGVYETMPTPGYSYQSWMLAEVKALTKALADKTSTESLLSASSK
ncbi:zinc ABC transporter substrate-binding protein [Acidisoma cellulosilytica]|uniref:Zinc ABC transporter substrate-binding protein n=1 Tax=Acidisoma cellulosilyticum TaxID=2802395 RepID=A0A963Z0P8_9PROT|nr:zinc ABC transporter substrate-binding protein [Acidisoma cellulosilyticum]MCB8880717.1 zinc ABC transporter substrate-binding protein [Acidisoma cellulosilyticum]